MGNTVAKVDPVGLPPPVTQSIDENELRPSLAKWNLVEVSHLQDSLQNRYRDSHPSKPLTFEAEVGWPTFFEAFEDVLDRVNERVKQRNRLNFHASCHAYAMIRKSRDMENGKLEPDPDVVKLESKAEEAREVLKEPPKPKPKPTAPKKPKLKWRYTVASEPKPEEMDEKQKRLDDIVKQRMSNVEEPSDADLDDLVARDATPTVKPTKPSAIVRKTWNPSVISPVFFGYTLAKSEQEDKRQLQARKVQRQEEVSAPSRFATKCGCHDKCVPACSPSGTTPTLTD